MKKHSIFIASLCCFFLSLNASTIIVTNYADSGLDTLRAAVQNAVNGDQIVIGGPSISPQIELLTPIAITANNLTIASNNECTLSGGVGIGNNPLFNVSAGNLTFGAININNVGGFITSDNNSSLTFFTSRLFNDINGKIDIGNGTITKNGSGSYYLQVDNAYSGQTTLNEGGLSITTSSALGTGAVLVQAGAALLPENNINIPNALTLNGAGISGLGAVYNGLGDNFFANTVILNSATTIGSGDGTLTLNNPNSITGTDRNLTFRVDTLIHVVGVIDTGSGSLTKQLTGSLILSGANRYSGGTTVSEGALIIENDEALGPEGSVLILDGAQLELIGGVTTTGTHALTLNGNGREGSGALLNVSNRNTYSSPITLDSETKIGSTSGTLALTNANSIIGTNQNLTFAGDGNIEVAGIIGTGTGTLTKEGAGTATLSGANTYTGGTTGSGGILVVDGSIAQSTVTMNAGSLLKGTGEIGPLILESGATVAPGNSIGTMTSGPVIFNTGSIFSVEIDPMAASLLNVQGDAALAGRVQVVANAGSYSQSGRYEILRTTGGITGSFGSVSSVDGFEFSLSRIDNSLYLFYVLGGNKPIVVDFICTAGLSGNALHIAQYLNERANQSTLALLNGLDKQGLKQALGSISPSRNAFGMYMAAQTAFSLGSLLSGHMDRLCFSRQSQQQEPCISLLTADSSDRIHTPVKSSGLKNKFSGWISGFGDFAHQKGTSQNPAFHFNSGGVLIGLDYKGGRRSLVGGALGYARTHYYEKNDAGHGKINYYFTSLYGNAFIDQFYLSPAIWGIFNQTENTRNISFPGFSQKAHADIFAWQLVPHIELGYEQKMNFGTMAPFSALDFAISWQRGYKEEGASVFNAKQNGHSASIVRSETGLKFSESWTANWGIIMLNEKISYVFEKPLGTQTVHTAFIGMPGAFTVTAVNQNLNLGVVGFNCVLFTGLKESVKVDLGYEGEFGASYWSNELMLTVSKSF